MDRSTRTALCVGALFYDALSISENSCVMCLFCHNFRVIVNSIEGKQSIPYSGKRISFDCLTTCHTSECTSKKKN